MSEETDIDLNRVKCPYCNEINMDVWEVMTNNDESYVECNNCGNTFIIHRNISYNVLKIN